MTDAAAPELARVVLGPVDLVPVDLGPVDPDRVRGALLGLAVGDAVGTALEFQRPDSFTPLTDLVGGGPFRLYAGARTDDTSMAARLAESLTVTGGLDPADQLHRDVRWYRDGHWSSTGPCFDIGGTTRAALTRFEAGDADTTAAIAGKLAGAHYGAAAIPAEWRAKLALREGLEGLADRLVGLAVRG